MTTLATYIYCNRFHESKSVLICAFRCPYWRGCKDWAGALAGEKKESIVAEVTDYATRKGMTVNPDIWDPLAPVKRRRKRPSAAVAAISTGGGLSVMPSNSPRSVLHSRDSSPERLATEPTSSHLRSQRGKKAMVNEEKLGEKKITTVSTRDVGGKIKPAAKRKRPTAQRSHRAKNPTASSVVYLVLEKNGRYREVKSEDEMKRIAIEIAGKGKKGVRFARATLLEAEVTFRPAR